MKFAQLFCFIAALLLTLTSLVAEENKRPNIIVILADDLGYSDIGCYGGEIETPNLDRLAKGGIRFTQFYNATRCCPTRASLLTGLYAHQAGIGHMMQDLGKPAYRGQLNNECMTIAEVLKGAQYHTAMSGKWHVSHIAFTGKPQLNYENNDPFWTNKNGWPLQRGFDVFYGTIHGVNSFYDPFSLTCGNEPIRPDKKNFYYTDAISDEATGFIEKFSKEKNPFFLYVAYTAPHWPLHALPKDIARYKNKYRDGWDALREQRHKRMIEFGIIDQKTPLAPRNPKVPAWEDAPNKEWEAHRMAVYAAMVDRMDRGIGRILKKLDETKLANNTLILFLSDNGACAENLAPNWYDVPLKTRDGRPVSVGNSKTNVWAGPDDVWQSTGPAWANASNTPLRLYKHWAHEGGIATPFIAYWPRGIKAKNKITTAPAHVIDLMPTFVELAGAKYPKEFNGNKITALEGRSLVPIFSGKTIRAERPLFWEHEGHRAVRLGKWKLVAEHKKDWELYVLDNDRNELNDLAAKNPAKVNELEKLYDAWAKRCGVLPWEEMRPY